MIDTKDLECRKAPENALNSEVEIVPVGIVIAVNKNKLGSIDFTPRQKLTDPCAR